MPIRTGPGAEVFLPTPESTSTTTAIEHPYGPERPGERPGYGPFSTPRALRGHARKILAELVKVARTVSGRQVRVFEPSDGGRCPTCTNAVTGERLITDCPDCRGSGRRHSWKRVGDFWTYVDFSPTYRMATPNGNVENPGGAKDTIIVLGAPLLRDQTLLIFIESREVYKIYDVEPHIVAMRGEVIAQAAEASRLTPGGPEYALIDW